MSWDALSPAWQAAFEEAWSAYRHGSLPIGACIADASGAVVARGRNRLGEARAVNGHVAGHDLGHAEINALLALPELDWAAQRALTVYATVEPCPQCAGAIGMSNLRGLSYAAPEAWSGCARLLTGDPYLGRKGFMVTRAPEPLPDLCLTLLLAALFEDGRILAPGHPFRAAFEAAHGAALAQAQSLSTLGQLPCWRREARTADEVYAGLMSATGAAGH